jgi:iron(III) transport system substrate-binding protein
MRVLLAAAAIAIIAAQPAAFAADAALIAAAKKEGEVTWYTTSIVDQFVRPAAQAFEKKYGIKVNYVRSNAVEMELRVINEARAGRMQADVVDGTTTSVTLKKQNLVEKWTPDVADLPERYRDPEGYWMASQQYVLTPGYNTDLVPKGSEPKTYEDLLDPKWKGKMVWNATPSSSAGQGFVGTVLMTMGEDKGRAYLAKLAKQNVVGMKAAARQVLDQVIAGEYAIALQIFNNHAPISKARGAPVDWLKLEKSMAVVLPMSLTKGAPHPNAGRLLFDFILSEEGQTIMANSGELPVLPSVAPKEAGLRPGPGFEAIYMSPEKLIEQIPAWSKIFDEYFR